MNQALTSISRRTLLGALGAGSLGTVLAPAAAGSSSARGQDESQGELIDLGVAMLSVNVRVVSHGTMPDGTEVIFAFSDGEPASFNVIRISDGQLLDSFTMDPDSIGASVAQHPDGSVYFSPRGATNGRLMRYDPTAGEIEDVATGVVGESLLRTLVIDPESGIVYGCTYPNAKVFAYDPRDGQIRDYGSIVTDNDRIWGFELVQGQLWCGSGLNRGHLISLDPESGDLTPIDLPEGADGVLENIHAIYRRGDLVLVSASPAVDGVATHVWDLNAGDWLPQGALEPAVSANGQATAVTDSGRFYYFSDGELWVYDPTANSSTATGMADSDIAEYSATRSVELVTSESGAGLVGGIAQDGTIWTYDPQAGTGSTVESTPQGAPATLHSIGIGPDQKVYTGAYLSSGVMARASTSTYEIEPLAGPDQADWILDVRGRLIITNYPNAVVYRGGTDPWQWGQNPEHWFTVGRAAHGQDRIFSAAPILSEVAFGTVPDYAVLGGALVLARGDGTIDVHRHIVEDHSVVSLDSRGPLLFGGTSIHGGLGAEPTGSEARLFLWDGRQRQKVFETVPVPGAPILHTVRVLGRRLWGMTSTGVIFEFDISSEQVLRTVDTGLSDSNSWGRLGNLYWRAEDERFYGNAGGVLFRFDPDSEEVTELSDRAKVSTLAPTGEIFLGDETNLYVFRP